MRERYFSRISGHFDNNNIGVAAQKGVIIYYNARATFLAKYILLHDSVRSSVHIAGLSRYSRLHYSEYYWRPFRIYENMHTNKD